MGSDFCGIFHTSEFFMWNNFTLCAKFSVLAVNFGTQSLHVHSEIAETLNIDALINEFIKKNKI